MGCRRRASLLIGLVLSWGCTTEFKLTEDGTSDAADADGYEGDASDTLGDDSVTVPCETDAECDNGVECDGDETCGPEGTCVPGSPLDCADDDPCTEDFCSVDAGGCVHDALDADDDGYPAVTSDDGYACGGTDCDDHDGSIHPDAAESCDMRDEDCDGSIMDAEGIDDDLDGVPDAECGGDDCVDMDDTSHGGFFPAEGTVDDPVEPHEEMCDGIDNDCNGDIDDGPGMRCVFGSVVTCTTICDIEGWGFCDACRTPMMDECIEPEEICNMASENCDPAWDEGVLADRDPSDLAIGVFAGEVWHVRACYDGSYYNVVWTEVSSSGASEAKFYYTRVDDTGTAILAPMILLTTSNVDVSGVPPNGDIACGTSRIGVVVNEAESVLPRYHVILYSIDSTGSISGYDMNQNANVKPENVGIAFDPTTSQWVVVWARPAANDVLMQRAAQDGTTGGSLSNQVVSSTGAVSPTGTRVDVAPNGSAGIAWIDSRGSSFVGHVFFKLMGTGPVVPGGEFQISDGDGVTTVDVAASGAGSQFRLVWDQSIGGTSGEIYTPGVNMVIVPTITDGPSMISPDDGSLSSRPSIDRWERYGEFVVSYNDYMSGYRSYVTRVSFDGVVIDGYYDPISPIGLPYHLDVVGGPDTDHIGVFWDDGRNMSATGFDTYMDLLGCF